MPRERAQIVAVVDTVKGLVLEMQSHTGGRINQLNKALDSDLYILKHITELRVARAEAVLINHVTLIYQDANYHTLRAYFYASPSLMYFIAKLSVILFQVWQIVKFFIQMVQIIQALKLDDLLATIWPAFEKARYKFRVWVAEISKALGWGADGLLHLIHATQTFTSMLGGLTGKSFTWMEAQWMVKTGNILDKVKGFGLFIKDNPGKMIEWMFQEEMLLNLDMSSKFGQKLSFRLRELTDKATFLLGHSTDIADDLIAIQEGMPEIIRANIPQVIWNSLEGFVEVVNIQILPRIATLERQLDLFDSVFNTNSNKISDLVNKLAHPGSNMLGIDDLSDYARQIEEGAIDNVSSRLWNDQVNADRDYMQADLNAFAIIDAAATSPLPVIPYLDIENPARGALHGIVVDPQETWFVGGYKSPY